MRSFCFPPFLKKQLCTLTWLASWLLQNYFTAQFNSRVKTYFPLPRKKPKWDDLSGAPYTSQEPPTWATAFPWAGFCWSFPGIVIMLSNLFYQKAGLTFTFFLKKYLSIWFPYFQYAINSGTIWSGFSAPCLYWRPDSDTSNCHSVLLCSDRSRDWLGRCAPTTA